MNKLDRTSRIAAAVSTATPAMDFTAVPVATPPTPADIELVALAEQLIAATTESRRLSLIVSGMDELGFEIQPARWNGDLIWRCSAWHSAARADW